MQVYKAESGMELRDLLEDRGFRMRRKLGSDVNRESRALRQLTRVFAETPERVLQELVDIAVEFCAADSSGISLAETNARGEPVFRWVVASGSFAQYVNGTTPRNYSPCGTCLDSGRPQLYRVTKPYYDFLGVTAEVIRDGILIPWTSGEMRGTLWTVSHRSGEEFDMADFELLNSLADLASIAVRYEHQRGVLRKAERDAASAALAHQLAHQINNPLQSLTNTLYLAQQGGPDVVENLAQAMDELESLSTLVHELLTVGRPR